MQVERNLHDAMGVARNVVRDPRLVPGGGAVEMALSRRLAERSAAVQVPVSGLLSPQHSLQMWSVTMPGPLIACPNVWWNVQGVIGHLGCCPPKRLSMQSSWGRF